MSDKRVILTRGLPASGKTTWAKAWVAEDPEHRARVNRDEMRFQLFVTPTYQGDQENIVTETERAAARALLRSGKDVVVDATNLRPKYCRDWARFAAANGAVIEAVEFPIELDDAIKRDFLREQWVGEDVIRRMHDKYTSNGRFLPFDEIHGTTASISPYEARPDKPDAVLVDVDGTLALNNSGRSFYDIDRLGEDDLHYNVARLVQLVGAAGITVIVCSGRDAKGREVTEAWLDRHDVQWDMLLMRSEGDMRKDSIVKLELFNQHVRHMYNILWVLDDRNQVVEMWRELGLTCLQVAPGDF